MQNFEYYIPTKVYFGKGQIQQLKTELPACGKKVLLVYGGGSIKRNGIYDAVQAIAAETGVTLYELSGVEPNPSIKSVRRGVEICKANALEGILAIGGGSALDCAKAVAAGACYDGDAWDLVLDWSLVKKALPIVTVLTIAATGSEMDYFAVISNEETHDKTALKHPLVRPRASIMDPTYTFTVSPYQTASGVADIMSHAMETYLAKDAKLQDYFAEAILRVCIECGPVAMAEPENYEARANLMWASSWAINDMIKWGHMTTWSVHPIEHQVSAVYNVTHGVGLAVLTPHWMEFALNEDTVDKFCQLAANVWKVPAQEDKFAMAREGIKRLRDFWDSLGIAKTLTEIGVDDDSHFEEMAEKAAKASKGCYVPMTKEDIVKIYQNSL